MDKVLVIALLFGVTKMSIAVEGTWIRKTDLPTARFGLSTNVVDGKIYVIGGGATMYGSALSIVEQYDPATDIWTRKTPMPTPRYGHAACVVNNKIYVLGGSRTTPGFLVTVEEYDPATDTWTRKADMPTRRTFLCACVVNGKIYAIGGRAASDPPDPGPSTLEVYDPVTDTWTKRGDMPIRRASAAACVVDGKIYVIGGVLEDTHGAPLSTVNEYDPAIDIWTSKADMPTARLFLSTSSVNGKIYAFGGAVYGGPVLSTVEEYYPVTDTWTTKPQMPTRRAMLSTSVVNNRVYALGGTDLWYPWTGISAVEEYDLTPPPPDFNSDGIVDIKDLLRLIESWGQDDPLCDIAPQPFGDGIVDALDLELLMSYWGQPVNDPTLIAHWTLDEVDGNVAYDSAGVNDAIVVGGPVWQPGAGKVAGALAFDGVDDRAFTQLVLNPADGPFSVFAWIQGGIPGQAVVSQFNGANWLGADSSRGCLMTDLCAYGRNAGPLKSETVITDGDWHRIGFAWDGEVRALYVDDLLVAEDIQQELTGSINGLNIGTGKAMIPGTYFSGLIDDVRVYNRAVTP